jgi:dipeptidyl-peptidase 4
MHSYTTITRSGQSGRTSSPAIKLALLILILALAVSGAAQRPNQANWPLADRFSNDYMRLYVYSTSVTPGWINNTDNFWYAWRSAQGITFYHVDPKAKSKKPLFDHVKLAGQLSELSKKPYEHMQLPFNTVTFTEKGEAIRFVVENIRYEYDLKSETLRSLGRAPRPGQQEGQEGQGQGQRRGGPPQAAQQQRQDFRNFSPDKKAYVYAQDHNLFYVEVVDGKDQPPVQLTKDGERYYSFGSRGEGQGQQQQQQQQRDDQQEQEEEQEQQQERQRETRVRANVTWSKDSKRFFVTRSDSRNVADLFLVNSLSQPRPTLMTYKYSMPGEENVGQLELFAFDPDKKELKKLAVDKWKDQRLFNIHWNETSDQLRFVRRDRLQRNLELCDIDLTTMEVKPLLSESVENAFLERQDARYVKPGGDFIWFSERNGWGHFYLYSNDGKLKNPITTGAWRADQIVAVDADKSTVWLRGVGREPGRNPYFRHLYRLKLDGTGLSLLDEGDADQNSVLSPSRRYIVTNGSRVDMLPKATLRDENGRVLMELEEMDVSRLIETGWRMPEAFVVKAADGITDIYGNMWKPFDFDPKKQYPIILHVYPGPQTESVTSNFAAMANNQRLAHLGFIVVQIGNRGGNPLRSNAYHSFGYYNLRDYGLGDKKAGVEQLAVRHRYIDIDRVGIYGHSGGGFMTAAALLLPPYNDFFKVGVSSAGNHDNNVYNQNWSEQHHGLKEVAVKDKDGKETGETKFEIKVPTNHELAANLKGKLLLVHGDMDNNVHPAGTIRLVDALIKANKRFDFMLMPGQAHGFGPMQGYFTQMMMEYFAEHLLGDNYRRSADMREKSR